MKLAVRVTTGAKVNHLQSRLAWLSEKNVLGFEISVDDLISPDEAESNAKGVSKVTDESRTEPYELVLLDQFVEVDGHQFKDNAGVASKDEAVLDVDNIGSVCLIFSQQLLQDLDFSLGLLKEPLVIAHNLKSRVLLGFMIIDLENLTKGTFTKHSQDLIPM